jgi:DNA mismatch endonuclease (patch repair protein)
MSTVPISSTPRRTPEQVNEVMRAVSSSSTEPEKRFHKALRRNGVRSFRICDAELPGKPDIVLPSRKLAIFIDGDFWHGNQYRVRNQLTLEQQFLAVNNGKYWKRKIGNNIARDLKVTSQFVQQGAPVISLGRLGKMQSRF